MAKNDRDAEPSLVGSGAEEVLSHLEQAEEALQAQQESWERRLAELERAVEGTRETNRELGDQMEKLQGDLQAQRTREEAQRRRASELAEIVKEMHRSLFSGNVYELILRACLTTSGATRGVYVTWRHAQETPRVRAAVDVDGYPQAPPSDFLVALCRRVVESRDTLVCNQASDLESFPAPTQPGERFRTCAVVPTMLLRDFDGIVLVADKLNGEFDEDDLETLISVGGQAAVAVENLRLQRELQRAYLSAIATLADAVEAKDPYTHGHCEEASRFARLTADRLGLSDQTRSVVCYAALLHDVGKIGVSDGVLHKPGPLLPEERELVRAHVRVGYELIRNTPALEEVARAVLHHHEWWDGGGYPDGLEGEQIPIASRVISVVDAYGAMTTRRAYKEAYTDEHARSELRRAAGTQFDPRVVAAFLEVLDSPDDGADDDDAECGLLPGFAHVRDLQPAG